MALPGRAVNDGSSVGGKACPEEIASTKRQLAELRDRRLVQPRREPAIPDDPRDQDDERRGNQTRQRKRWSASGLARHGNVARSLRQVISQARQIAGEVLRGGVALTRLLLQASLHNPSEGNRGLRVQRGDCLRRVVP